MTETASATHRDRTEAPALQGQVAIVTGGGRGIGRAIARALAGAGAQVAVAARSADQLAETVAQIERDGGHAIATPVDVVDAEGVVAMVQRVTRDLGPVDLLVNNAGSFAAIGPVWEVDPEQWWRDVETNLRGTFHCARAVLPGMIERGHGTIVNLSGGGSTNAFPYGSGYGSSKAAIVRFSEVLAKEAEEHGVYVYAMGPGLVRTAMTEYQLTTPQGQHWLPRIARSFEDGRNVPPERAGQLAVFLASLATQHPAAAAALSGRAFGVADNPDDLLRRAESIQQADHYTLRLSR